MKKITIMCDGSSLGNGGEQARAAAAAVLEYQGHRRIVGEFLGNFTNQQAEIVAACLGLEALKEACEVEMLSDSQYVVRTMSGEFKRKANHDFWRRLDDAASRHQIVWKWVRGHAGDPIQEKCDQAARMIAEMGTVDQQRLNGILLNSRGSR